MYELIDQLMTLHAKTTQGKWEVTPVLCPELDDDPMAEYVIINHQATLAERYFSAAPESNELDAVHAENSANAEFIALAHDLIPQLARQVDKLEDQEWQWENAVSMNVAFFKHLTETSVELEKTRHQIQHIRTARHQGEDVIESILLSDHAVEAIFDRLDTLAASLSPYLRAIRRDRAQQIDKVMHHFFGAEAASKDPITRVNHPQSLFLFAKNSKDEGYFLVNDPVMGANLTRSVFHALVGEARAAGLTGHRWHVFARLCPYSGPGIEFYPLPDDLINAMNTSFLASPLRDGIAPQSMNSSDLLALVKDFAVEASHKVGEGARTRHILTWQDNSVKDVGLDDVVQTLSLEQFLQKYPDQQGEGWRVYKITSYPT